MSHRRRWLVVYFIYLKKLQLRKFDVILRLGILSISSLYIHINSSLSFTMLSYNLSLNNLEGHLASLQEFGSILLPILRLFYLSNGSLIVTNALLKCSQIWVIESLNSSPISFKITQLNHRKTKLVLIKKLNEYLFYLHGFKLKMH